MQCFKIFNKFGLLVIIIFNVLLGCASEESDWAKAKKDNTELSYEIFLKKYPKSSFAKDADTILKNLQSQNAFDNAQKINSIEVYETFISKFPESKNITLALDNLSELRYGKLSLPQQDGSSKKAMTFGQRNATWSWGLEPNLEAISDAELPKIGAPKIGKLKLLDKNEGMGIGAIYWIGGKLFFDRNGNIFHEDNYKNKTRFLEVSDTADKKIYRVLRVEPLKNKFMFRIVAEWKE
jgi:hypothetical protein